MVGASEGGSRARLGEAKRGADARRQNRSPLSVHSSSPSPSLRGYLRASVYAMLATHPLGATYRVSLAAE